MSVERPLVSIGLPVYNGERFLAEALDSILAQTFTDFELILADNASTDSTPEICRAYAARDSRIRFVPSDVNRGAAWNFNRVFELSRGRYFKWHAADDLIAPTFLERCVAALEADPGAVLAFSRVRVVDQQGVTVEECSWNLRGGSSRPSVRFRDLAVISHRCYEVFGLIRSNALRTTRLIDTFVGSDRILLVRLALLGRFYEAPEPLFISRRHPGQSVRINFRKRAVWFDSRTAGRVVLPQWRNLIELHRQIRDVGLPPAERARCYGALLEYVATNKNWARLGYDLLYAGRQLAAAARTGLARSAAEGS